MAAEPDRRLSYISLNYGWWREVCSLAFIASLARSWGDGGIADLFGPAGSMIASAEAAAAALDSFRQAETFANEERYRQSVFHVTQHIKNINSSQFEFHLDLDFGPRLVEVDYADSRSITGFAHRPSLLSTTIDAILAREVEAPDFVGFFATSPYDLAAAAIASVAAGRRWPRAYRVLLDHGYENFSLEPHIGGLTATGAFAGVFDAVIAAKEGLDQLAPRLIDQASNDRRSAGFLSGPPADPKPEPEPPPTPATALANFAIFNPAPVTYVRASERGCYWRRCAFCTQNNKYGGKGAPRKSDLVQALDHIHRLARQGIDHVYFKDEAISPGMLRRLCQEIRSRDIRLRWACRCRFENALTRDLLALARETGCYEILFGLETTSRTLLRRMGKTPPRGGEETMRRILADMADLKLGVHLNLISGFPGEELNEAQATVDWVISALRQHPNATYRLNAFALFPATPILARPADYGVTAIAGDCDMPSSYRFELDPPTAARTGPVARAYGALSRQLDAGLGWQGLTGKPGGRECKALYFDFGHGAILKSAQSNPMERSATAKAGRGRRRHSSARPRRIFLTGGSGNVGSAVKAALLAENLDVVIFSRDGRDTDSDCRCVTGDLADPGRWAGEIERAEAIIHCASPRSLDREAVLASEIAAVARLADAWRRGPFIAMSSQTVYGPPRQPLVETAALHPSTWYDVGKVAVEATLAMASLRQGRGPGIAFRLPLLFSAGPRRRDRQFLPPIVDALRAGKTFLFDRPEGMCDYGSVFIGAGDLGRAALLALEMKEPGPYNLASGFVTWTELIEGLAEFMNLTPRFAVCPAGPRGADDYWLPQSKSSYNCRRFRQRSGFVAEDTIGALLRRFLENDM